MSTKKFTIIASVLFALSVVVTPAFAACDLQNLSQCDQAGLLQLIAQLGGSTSGSTGSTGSTGSITGIPAGFQFTQTLKQGSTGIQVKYLQILLNADPATAVGNAGNETSYFGAMTKAAVNKFQTKYAAQILTPLGLTAPTGNWAAATRAVANQILASGTVGTGTGTGLPAGCTSTSGYSPTTGQPCSGGTGTVIGSGFTARLATDNPAASTLVTGQATGDLAHYTFSNGTGSAVSVTGVELTRIGVSADATLRNVYLFNGATRITDAGTVSSGKVNFNAVNGLFTVPANSSVTISVKSDIAAGTGGQQVGVSLSGVTSNGTLTSTLPIAGNIFTIAQANLATVAVQTILPGASTTDPVNGVLVWQANLVVGVNNVNFTKLALRQINSITAADISNFKVQVDGTEVATVASLDSNNMVTFTFDKALNTGTRIVKVFADVTGGSSRFISMSLRNAADIDLKDAQYGVNVTATGIPATAGPITVNPGNITATINNSALPVTVANNASNVLIGKYTFKATGEAIRVDNLYVGMTLGTDIVGATLRNAKVMINGSQAGSTQNLQRSALGVANLTPFAVNYTFQPGVETTVEIYADIFNNGTGAALAAGNTIRTNILVPGATILNGTRQVSLGLIAVPTTAQNGAAVAIGASAATLSMTSGYTNQTTVVPHNTMKIGSWTMKAGTAEDINVSGFSFVTAAVGGAADLDINDLANMYVVYKVGSGAETTTSVVTTPTATQAFSVSFTLPRTQTATIDLYADITGLVGTSVTAGASARTTLTVTGTGSQSGAASAIPASLGQLVTVQNGTITVTRDASAPNAALVAQNNTISSVAYKFTASNDSYDVVQLTFSIDDPSAVSQVNLMDGTTVLASASPASTIVFNGFATPITINANTPKILTLQLVLGPIGVGAGETGANVTSDFVGGLTSTASLLRPGSTGIAGGVTYTDAPGNAIFVYQAVPTITPVSLPSGVLQAGTNVISKFQIGTTTGGTVSWKELAIAVAKTGAATGVSVAANTDLTLWDVDNNVQVPANITVGGGAILETEATETISIITNTEQTVSGARNYELRAVFTVVGVITVGDYFQTRILNPSTVHSMPTPYAQAVMAKDVVAGTGLAYTAAGATVAVGDDRLTLVPSYTTADVAAAAAVVGHDAATVALIEQSYGIPASFVMTLAEGAVDDQAAAATFTVGGVSGLTCTPYTNANFTGAFAAGGTFASIQSISCNGNGMQLRIGGLTITPDTGAVAGDGTLTITVTKGADYPITTGAPTRVVAGDSDIGLTITALGIPSFVWSDTSAALHDETTRDWNTDYLVKNLPTNTQNLVK